MDRISLNVDSLKLISIPPKHDINESLKAMRISIDECKERTARMCAKKDAFIRACSSSSYENKDEDLKVIDVSPIKSLFCNMNHIMMGLNMIHLYLEGVPKIWSF